MPNKQSGTGRKAAAGKQSSATVRQRAPRALADFGASPGDPPIIVQGGGSIDLDVPPKFKEKTKKGGKFKNADQDLDSIIIDDGTPIKLTATSVIRIYYKTSNKGTAGGGGAGKKGPTKY